MSMYNGKKLLNTTTGHQTSVEEGILILDRKLLNSQSTQDNSDSLKLLNS